MTLRHLSIFICVCEENNMTRAAARLHMTQPSVSQVIRELEEHYQTHLFERFGHRLFITEAGKRLLSYAYQIIALNKQAEAAMQSFSEDYTLRIGASVTIGEAFLVELLQYMAQKAPKQNIFSEIHNTAELEDMLLHNELDLALVEGEIRSEYLQATPFLVDEMVIVIAPEHDLAKKGNITNQDLAHLKYFVREAGSGTRQLFEATMSQHHIPFQTAGVYNNAEALKKAVMAGLGASVISQRSVKNELAQGTLATLTVPDLSFQRIFQIVHHKNKYISPALQQLIDACFLQ